MLQEQKAVTDKEIRVFCADYNGEPKTNATLYEWNEAEQAYVYAMCYKPWKTFSVAIMRYALKGVPCYVSSKRLHQMPMKFTLKELESMKVIS